MSKNILDNLGAPDINFPHVEDYYGIKIWIDLGIVEAGKYGVNSLLSSKAINKLINSYVEDINYPFRQQMIDIIVEKDILE